MIRRLLLTIVALLFASQPAFAWNGHGHRVIASIAFQELEPDRRLELADRIRNHPRFGEDFDEEMPDEVKAGDEQMQAEWLFQQAACWPDMARSLRGKEQKLYNRPTWHYINQPLYLRPGDEVAVGTLDLNLSTVPPDAPVEGMNVVQTIEFVKVRVEKADATPENDALMICWLLHCFGDLHQPLHTTAMFSRALLHDGCRGGNRIPTKQGRNLHSLWDGLIGSEIDFRECRNEAIEMRANDIARSDGSKSATANDTVEVWNQSHALCSQYAYAGEVRAHLIRLEDSGKTKIVELDLSEGYLKTAGQVAHFQAARAGLRLGELLK